MPLCLIGQRMSRAFFFFELFIYPFRALEYPTRSEDGDAIILDDSIYNLNKILCLSAPPKQYLSRFGLVWSTRLSTQMAFYDGY